MGFPSIVEMTSTVLPSPISSHSKPPRDSGTGCRRNSPAKGKYDTLNAEDVDVDEDEDEDEDDDDDDEDEDEDYDDDDEDDDDPAEPGAPSLSLSLASTSITSLP